MSRPTKTILGEKARKAIHEGVNSIYQPVRMTFGPEGKNALLYRTWGRGPRITNDGYTVAECQEPRDPFARLAAQAFKESCKRTNEKVGDGTTGTAIIGGKLFNEIYRLLSSSSSEITTKSIGSEHIGVMTLKNKILQSANAVKKAIMDSAKKVTQLEELEHIATISVQDVELGKIIAKVAWDVGIDGFIDVVEGYKGEIEIEQTKGFKFPAKVPAKRFVNRPERYEMVAEDCPVVVTNYTMDSASQIGAFTQNLHTQKLIIIAPSFSESVLLTFVKTAEKGFLIFPVAVPSLRTEQFEDLAIYSGAQFIDKNKGKKVENIREHDLGFFEKLIVKEAENKEDAVATGGNGAKPVFADGKVASAVVDRIETLKGQLEETRQEQFKILLKRRIASMASAGGIIRVGDSTQASALYLKLKIEDAVNACKAALRGGHVKGAGICLKEISESLPEDDILKVALMAPYEQIQSSVDGGIEIGENIIDPAEAIFYAVEHATGVVANLITVDIITPETEDLPQGEGEFAIAKALNEFAISDRIHKGQMSENEREMERDRLNGFTTDEITTLDNG